MAQQVQLCYTPYGGAASTLNLDVLAVRGSAEPDGVQVFPSLRHEFLDGSLSEEIAGGRRNIEIVLAPVEALNRRKLVQFWLDPDRTIKTLVGQPGSFTSALSAGGSLLASKKYNYGVRAIDAVGGGIVTGANTKTTNATDKTITSDGMPLPMLGVMRFIDRTKPTRSTGC